MLTFNFLSGHNRVPSVLTLLLQKSYFSIIIFGERALSCRWALNEEYDKRDCSTGYRDKEHTALNQKDAKTKAANMRVT